MTGERQRHLLRRNAAAVVGDGDALDAALFQAHGDLRGAGIERVLQQFLDDGGRAFDDFAGSDLRNQLVGQGLNRAKGAGRAIWCVHPAIIPPAGSGIARRQL